MSSTWWTTFSSPLITTIYIGGSLLTKELVNWVKTLEGITFEPKIWTEMDIKSNNTSPVLTDTAAMNNTRLSIHSSLLPYSPNNSSFAPTLFLTIPFRKPGILDDVRSSMIEAMKSSSPTHNKITIESNTETTLTNRDLAYCNWMVWLFMLFDFLPNFDFHKGIFVILSFVLQLKYPSALASFEQIANCAKGKRIALFMDYDGTLSPIVDNPDHAFMSNSVRINLY